MPQRVSETGEDGSQRLALAVADVNWFTTESLFREIDRPSVSILALRCMDYVNGWHQGVFPWSSACRLRPWGTRSHARTLVLPSGWMKRFPRLGMRPIARVIRRFWDEAGPPARRGLVLTYPHYLYLRDQLEPDVILYYNVDDYALYWPRHAETVRRLERKLVLRSHATVCVARARAEELRAALPQARDKIHHVPHGTPGAFLTDHPLDRPDRAPADLANLPRPVLGYIGSIGSRVDWRLMLRLSEAFPRASIVLIGSPPSASRQSEDWLEPWGLFADRPNVHHLGWRAQAELPCYYQAFDVNLIPYDMADRFNRASSPTKIMDGMGSGRPIVATAIPECRLYSDLFDVAVDAEAFVASVEAIVASGSDDGRAGLRHTYAREHTCRLVADRVLRLIDPEPVRGHLEESPVSP
jgi:glycosyltransferase involved in cell wall biosynthesis